MNREELIRRMAEELDFPKGTCGEMIDCMFDNLFNMVEELEDGGKVRIGNYISFHKALAEAHTKRIPSGAIIEVQLSIE